MKGHGFIGKAFFVGVDALLKVIVSASFVVALLEIAQQELAAGGVFLVPRQVGDMEEAVVARGEEADLEGNGHAVESEGRDAGLPGGDEFGEEAAVEFLESVMAEMTLITGAFPAFAFDGFELRKQRGGLVGAGTDLVLDIALFGELLGIVAKGFARLGAELGLEIIVPGA